MGRWLALVALVPACSFAFVKEPDGPALNDVSVSIDCTSERTLPIADAVIGAVLGGLVAANVYAILDRTPEDSAERIDPKGPALLGAFLIVSPWWISSAVGFSDTSRCRAAYRARGVAP